jgi:hypothetical protein
MTQLIINVGASANDGLGDPLRTSFTYCNSNFSELYSRVQTTPPTTLIGVPGDQAGMYAYDSTYFYYCFANFDGVTAVWNKALTISEPGNYGNANVASYLNGSAGNIIPANNGVQNLGNVARPFKDVFLSNSTITLNSIPVTVVGSKLLVNGSNVVIESSVDNSISVTGNISGNYFIGNGSQLTGINANYSNANVADYLPTYSGNISALAISTTGNVSVAANLQVGSGANMAFSMSGPDCRIISRTSGGNINLFTNVAGTVTQQVRILGNGSGLLSLSNVAADNYLIGNIINANTVSITGTVTGGNLATAGLITATGTVTGGNLATAGTISATGNAVIGNVLTGGLITATGNIIAGNLATAGLITATGNITGGNILTAGRISATGPVSVGVYTAANLNLITGTVGSLAAVSDSTTVGGRLAFWDTTNSRWSYVSDNTAV